MRDRWQKLYNLLKMKGAVADKTVIYILIMTFLCTWNKSATVFKS